MLMWFLRVSKRDRLTAAHLIREGDAGHVRL